MRFRKRARFSRSLVCWQRFFQLSSCDAGNYSNFRNNRAFCFRTLLVWHRRGGDNEYVASALLYNSIGADLPDRLSMRLEKYRGQNEIVVCPVWKSAAAIGYRMSSM